MSKVTIGLIPRDRFCKAAEALELLYQHTDEPFDLVIVDCNTPVRFRTDIQRAIRGRRNVEVIRSAGYLLNHQSSNLVLARNRSEYLCLMENDILVQEGWLSGLLEASERHAADATVPLILEELPGYRKIHFDDRLGSVDEIESDGRMERVIVPRRHSKEYDAGTACRQVGMIETHIVLYRSSVLERIGPFDESLSSRVEVDVSLALHRANAKMILEPGVQVRYSPPPPIFPEERDYYLFKHDVERAACNHEYLKRKWDLRNLPDAVEFARRRRVLAEEIDPQAQLERELGYRSMLERAAQELAGVIPEGELFILADQMQWKTNEVARGRCALPFLEREGQYWGLPPDDETAIRELERLRAAGAQHFVFAEPAFWWFDYYPRFVSHLRANYPCVLESDRIISYALRP